MNLIDNKGRFFGKLNIIDLCVLLILLLVIITSVKYLFLGGLEDMKVELEKKAEADKKEKERAKQISEKQDEVKIEYIQKKINLLINIPHWMDPHITLGLKQKYNNKTIATITDKILYQDYSASSQFTLQLNILAQEQNGEFVYQKQTLKIGKPLTVRTDRIDIHGTITDMK